MLSIIDLLLAGCNNKVHNPPPPKVNKGVIHNNDGNGVNNNKGLGDGHNDINTNNDGNPPVDQNTPKRKYYRRQSGHER